MEVMKAWTRFPGFLRDKICQVVAMIFIIYFVLNENPTSILSIEGSKEVALELNSLSKTFNMAGWRVGMVLGNQENLKSILKVKSNMDSGMFYGIQKGAIEALHLSDDWFLNQNKVYEERRNLVFQLADKLNCTYNKNSTGLFVWAKIPRGKTVWLTTLTRSDNLYLLQLLYVILLLVLVTLPYCLRIYSIK